MLASLLSIPWIYNLRFLVAGNQQKTKEYILSNYRNLSCKSVLDVGCGTGDFAPLFSPVHYLGVDINPQYIIHAKRAYPHEFLAADVVTYSWGKRMFDAALFISTLHHLSDTHVHRLFPPLLRITKKAIIIVDLNPETSFLKYLLVAADRGDYVRTTAQKIALLSRYGTIQNMVHFSTRLASQTGMVLIPHHDKTKRH
jgi:ubiquinone/menaquinone biosynthesis C-methylase UbiE